MLNKKMLFLAAGYVIGGVVSSIYSKKKGEEVKKELVGARKKGENDFGVLMQNFIETQANMFEELKNDVLTDKNKKLINEKKQQFLDVVESYKTQGQEVLEELQANGKEFIVEASEKLETLYEEKKSQISKITDISPEVLDDVKERLIAGVNDIQKKVETTAKKTTKTAKSKIKKLKK